LYDLIIKFIEESDPKKYKIEDLKELKRILEETNKKTEKIHLKRRENDISKTNKTRK
jgi:hypothetical protein